MLHDTNFNWIWISVLLLVKMHYALFSPSLKYTQYDSMNVMFTLPHIFILNRRCCIRNVPSMSIPLPKDSEFQAGQVDIVRVLGKVDIQLNPEYVCSVLHCVLT